MNLPPYSSFTEEKATNLNLTGFVKNASDGTVRYPSAGIFPFAFLYCIHTLHCLLTQLFVVLICYLGHRRSSRLLEQSG